MKLFYGSVVSLVVVSLASASDYFNRMDPIHADCIPVEVKTFYYVGNKSTDFRGHECAKWNDAEVIEKAKYSPGCYPHLWDHNFCRFVPRECFLSWDTESGEHLWGLPHCYTKTRGQFEPCYELSYDCEATTFTTTAQPERIVFKNKKKVAGIINDIGRLFSEYDLGDVKFYDTVEADLLYQQEVLKTMHHYMYACFGVFGLVFVFFFATHFIDKSRSKRLDKKFKNERKTRKAEKPATSEPESSKKASEPESSN
ncbi:hypothetical protein QR680_010818 [Steinernema hermaphroditum]|uniref:Kringle domain-containing protein n=1 Tax=Steinernema hermaphroditum TaxID=289476 RepID=A0AA39IRL5_9BILA|nr:hypothetical protein QR680_010818 [Steinernema hermaphroditum]